MWQSTGLDGLHCAFDEADSVVSKQDNKFVKRALLGPRDFGFHMQNCCCPRAPSPFPARKALRP